jgi:putative transposase
MENMRLRQRIREEFARSRRTYGSPRLAQVLGCPGRRNRIARLMRAERLFARQRSKYRVATTDSRHGGPIAPNRLQGLAVKRPNQVWTTDATAPWSIPHHPLRSGSSVRQRSYRQLLTQHRLLASMSRKDNCYDNAFIESFWSTLKYELVYHQRFATYAAARTAIFDYIETFYNRTRLHSSLDYLSPINFESQLN